MKGFLVGATALVLSAVGSAGVQQLGLLESLRVASQATGGAPVSIQLSETGDQWLLRLVTPEGRQANLRVNPVTTEVNGDWARTLATVPNRMRVGLLDAARVCLRLFQAEEGTDAQILTVSLQRGKLGPYWRVEMLALDGSARRIYYHVDAETGDVTDLQNS